MVAVRVDQVDAERALPVGDPLEPLQRRVDEEAAVALAQDALRPELVRRRRRELERDVLARQEPRADDRVEVVDADHVELPVVGERVPLGADQLAR